MRKPSLAGDWQGTLDANGTTFHLVWHVTAAADGTFTSTFDNLDEGVYGIKAKTTTIKGSDVTAEVDDTVQANGQHMKVSGSLVGKLNADGTEMDRHIYAGRAPGSTDSQRASSNIRPPRQPHQQPRRRPASHRR